MLQDYYDFETKQMEDSKENIIYRLWFARKQAENQKQINNQLKDRISELEKQLNSPDIKANESAMICSTKSESLKDRKLFVKNLGNLLSQTRGGVESCELGDDEIVTINYKNGYQKFVNVNMNSYSAIIRDVAKHCD